MSPPERTPCSQSMAPAGTRKAISCASPRTSLSCTCRPTAPNSIPSRMSGPTCAATNSATASSKPTRISSMPAAMHGVGSCVERPGIQGRHCENWRRHECGHVSGLLMRHHGRWPRWVPRMASKHFCGLDVPLTQLDYRYSSVRPIAILFYRSCLLGTGSRSGCCRLPPVDLTTRHHRPDNPGDLVGQSDGCDFARPALQQLQQPSTGRFATWFGEADHRHGTNHQ